MNTLVQSMRESSNYKLTENGGISLKSTLSGLLDLFAMGAAYRTRSEVDCIHLFKKAFEEDELHALRCLFYLRDCREGQGERRFFRVNLKWLAKAHPETVRRNLENIPFYGRWDDLFVLFDTPVEPDAMSLIRTQLALDVQCKTPSLLAKWLPSENTSSAQTRALGTKVRKEMHMTSRQYRKTLSILRKRINVLERLMSAGEWDKIEFDKIPSKAGLIYRNAFARHDIERKKNKAVQSYEDFAKDKNTTVNAGTLYPCEVVHQALGKYSYWGGEEPLDETQRNVINKYWDNLRNEFQNAVFNGVAVVDTSGSMWNTGANAKIAPMDVACALGMYCAEKCNPNSPWYGHYISFSRNAKLVEIEGIDFVDKVRRIRAHNLCENTNIESVFNLILSLAIKHNIPQSEMPENIIVVSDMEFDQSREYRSRWGESVIEGMVRKYHEYGYEMPRLIFWNVQCRHEGNIPMKDNGNVTFVSGYSPVLFQQILSGKTGLDFVLEKLDNERYQCIH